MIYPQDQTFWYLKEKKPRQLRHDIETDVVIIGGGMAGLSAAQSFAQKGQRVVVLEKTFCGAGATGKSTGFITPNSELGLVQLVRQFGPDDAKKLWDFVTGGVTLIKNNINHNNFACDYHEQDTLVVATSNRGFNELKLEHETRLKLGYESNLFAKNEMPHLLGTDAYYGGNSYGGTFGISAFLYCQELKSSLEKGGSVTVYEETPVTSFNQQGAQTAHAKVKAKHIIVCVDRFLPDFCVLTKDVYHAQTFVMISNPLPPEVVKSLFPQKSYLVWDTDMIYHYYRLVEGNRLIVGGGDVFTTLAGHEQHNNTRMMKKLSAYITEKFPQVDIRFDYFWPGLIGISKNLVPIADVDTNHRNIFYISAATGLPWAAALGNYSAEYILDGRRDLELFFTSHRRYTLGHFAQAIFGKRITFGLCNLFAVYGR